MTIPSGPKRAAIYARVSTSEDRELQDPTVQVEILRDHARARNLEIVGEFVDHGTGKTADGRQRFLDMIHEAEELHTFNYVLVLRLDRFMRDVIEGLSYIKRLRSAGVDLIIAKDSVLGNVDTSTPYGQFFLTVILAVADLERAQIVERTKEGIARFQEERGYWGAGKNRRKDINTGIAAELLKVHNLSQVAEIMHVPRTTLRAHLIAAGVEIPTKANRPNTTP